MVHEGKEAMDHPTIAVVGASGRIGRAVIRRLGAPAVSGLDRSPGPGVGALGRHVRGDRHDAAALAAAVDGCRVVIDTCCFDERDADALLDGLDRARGATALPIRVVSLSSLAERPSQRWQMAESTCGDPTERALLAASGEPYGLGKRAARERLEAAMPGRVISLLLPSVLVEDDAGSRLLGYLQDSGRGGAALIAGTGRQRLSIAPAAGVAEVIAAIVADPIFPAGALHVAPPTPVVLGSLVEALLVGAGLAPRWLRHPDPAWRGPHSGGDELVMTDRLQSLLPALTWPDLIASARAHGAFLAARAAL